MIDDDNGIDVRRVLSSNVRRLRIAAHRSLSELARATSTSKATLSGIERGLANPTIDTLAGLAGALGVSIGELLDEPAPAEVRVVRSREARPATDDGMPRRLLDWISPGWGVEVCELALVAHHSQEVDAKASGARIHLYVLDGSLIAGPVERCTELAAGDYAAFPGDVEHVYETARRPARALVMTQLADGVGAR
jgi:transcriptional regulator with XRE-family HTH domain